MRLKRISLLTLLAGVLLSIAGLAVPFIALQGYNSQNGAIGIIGDADTPTYLFLLLENGWSLLAIMLGTAFVVSALLCLIFSKTVQNSCSVKTTALSLGLSAACAAGLVCVLVWYAIAAFGKMSMYPIEYPASIILGLICLFIFIVLIGLYVKFRTSNRSIKGVFIDAITGAIYLPSFFLAFLYLYGLVA